MNSHTTTRNTRFGAGNWAPLSRLPFRSVCLLVLFVLCLPISSPSQTQTKYENETALIAALANVAKDPLAVTGLLDGNRELITPRLWQALSTRALSAYYQQGADTSLQIYAIALDVAGRLNDGRKIATTHYNIGKTFSSAGRTPEAIQAYLSAKGAFEKAGLHRDVIYILSDLGALAFYASDYKQARMYSEGTLALAERVKGGNDPPGAWPDEYGVAGAWSTLGALSRYEGAYARAIEQLQKAIAIYEQLDRGTMRFGFQLADNLAELSRVHGTMGDHRRALSLLNRALTIAKRLPQRDMLANVLNSIGILYLEQEDYDKAGEYLQQSLQTYQAIGNKAEAARALLNLGVTSQRRGDLDRALALFQQSLAAAMEAGNKDVMIAAGEGLGAVHRERKEYSAALDALEKSLALAREISDQVRIAEILWRKAQAQQATGNFAEAVTLAESALDLARQLQLPKLSYLAATTLGQGYVGQQKIDQAIQTFSAAIDRIESMREHVVGEEQGRQLYFENHLTAYHSLIDLLIDQGQGVQSLLLAERAKARVLLDAFGGGQRNRALAMTPEQKAEDERFKQDLIRLNNQLREARQRPATDRNRLQQLAAELDAHRFQYVAFQDVLAASRPELGSRLGRAQSITQETMKRIVRNNQTVFLEYVITKDRVSLFVLQPGPQVTLIPLPVTTDELTNLVAGFHRTLSTRRPAWAASARQLYDLLIKPAEAELRGKESVCIVPDGVLWELPFQALQSGPNRFLIEDFAISYAPSLSVLDQMAKPRSLPAPSLLAFANPAGGNANLPALPFAESEVRSIAKLFRPAARRIFIGPEADERNFKSMAAGSSILHFSTHGVLDNRHPLYSHLLLSRPEGGGEEDGLLEAREIMDLDLNADLVVLSACETARGRIGAGEGVIGMSWAFFLAGSRAALVSQWKVSSDSTEKLLVDFYRQFNNASQKSKAAALRAAARKLIRDSRYRHPFYWAGFVLIGSDLGR